MLRAIARTAPARPATRPGTTFFDGYSKPGSAVPVGRLAGSTTTTTSIESVSQKQTISFITAAFFSELRASHRGTSLSSCLYGASYFPHIFPSCRNSGNVFGVKLPHHRQQSFGSTRDSKGNSERSERPARHPNKALCHFKFRFTRRRYTRA